MYRKVLAFPRAFNVLGTMTLCPSHTILQSQTLTSSTFPRSVQFLWFHSRKFHKSQVVFAEKEPSKDQALVQRDFFDQVQNKNKETYLDMLHIYESREVHRRGHVEFIYAAIRHMKDFGVDKDLEAYKSLINVLPKGKFIPTNIFQAEFMHYPKQQQCIIDVLEQMEDNGVIPDFELEDILVNIFGKKGHPVRKFWRMMYWMPKFKNLSPWLLPNPVPDDSLELAKLAMKRISSVDLQSKVDVYDASTLEDSLDKTWIVSAQSCTQKELVALHPKREPIFVEGSFRIWLRNAAVDYFVLRADPKPKVPLPVVDTDDVGSLKIPFFLDDPSEETSVMKVPSVHEQEDGTILAVCASCTSSKDSLLSWIRLLEKDGNPALSEIPILFTLKSPLGEVVTVDSHKQKEEWRGIQEYQK